MTELRALSPDAPVRAPSDGELHRLYRGLLLPRVIEEKMLSLLRQGQLSKWFAGIGQEAVAVGLVAGLRPDDWIVPGHRNLGVFTGRGLDPGKLFRQLLGRAGGYTGGRDRTFHFGAPGRRIVGMISHLGAMVPVADGLALAARLRGEDRVAAVLIGDGATSEGDVHEAMNLAAVWALPVVFVIENNQWALSTPVRDQYACADLVDRAAGYGMPGEMVDGNDVVAMQDAVRRAADRARAGQGPALIEAKTFRMRGHEEASGNDYVPAAEVDAWAGRDPIVRLEAVLDERATLPAPARAALRVELRTQVDRLVASALEAPVPSSSAADELRGVFGPPAPLRRVPVSADGASTSASVDGASTSASAEGTATSASADGAPASAGTADVRYVDAISDALRTAMRADERVVLLGQDIAAYGGVFKVTEGFLAEFGPDRVLNTPVIESGVLGAALGLAIDGFRPVVELQFGDFISTGFNQVVNNLATTRYRWGAAVPVVMRAPIGGGLGAGPFHSQSVEGLFCHVPGLRVVAPATPADAKGLLLAALDDGNPVLFLEHKALYRSVKGPVPAGHATVPLGRAAVVRPGADATIVAYGAAVAWAVAAAESVAAGGPGAGAEVEVVDLRTLAPWDRETVLESVRRTSRVLVAHEAPLTGGFGGEVAAVLADEAFAWLDAPVRRVGGLDTPIPFARSLEAVWSAQGRVEAALRDLLAF
ncbi:MAG TPA: dehydrogenase E1 component subunit alpha/beta [Acidimicrobiales bacterium]|nr:dehydrogenase E1 component subunit alpha/beta [Acidimicrobiales bacterium]